jgi:hypothetical protein
MPHIDARHWIRGAKVDLKPLRVTIAGATAAVNRPAAIMGNFTIRVAVDSSRSDTTICVGGLTGRPTEGDVDERCGCSNV